MQSACAGESLGLAASAFIVSFDIFDTLLVRPWYAADNVFAFLEPQVAKLLGSSTSLDYRTSGAVITTAKSRVDVNITQIYRSFAALAGCTPAQSNALMALEYETEMAGLQPPPRSFATLRALSPLKESA